MSADEVALEPIDGGAATLLPVRAQPGARRRGAAGVWNGHLRLAVSAPPEDGRANEEIVRLAAEILGVKASAVTLVRGHSARMKTLRVEARPEAVRAALQSVLERGR